MSNSFLFVKINYKDVRQKHWLYRKLKKSLLNDQPATPHNTTQFILNTVHFPTDPYVYDFDSDRYSGDLGNHSMLGSMRDMIDQFKPPAKVMDMNSKDHNTNIVEDSNILTKNSSVDKDDGNASDSSLPEVKGLKGLFPENAHEIMKVRSDNDAYGGLNRNHFGLNLKPQQTFLDIKTLIDQAKNGQNNLESVIQSLVDKIKEKDDIITNLQGK